MLWYMLFLALTLLAFSIVLYGSFRTELYKDFDDLLYSRAEGVENSINAYRYAKTAAAARGGKTGMENFVADARAWVDEKRKDPELMSIFVQILDTKGRRLVAAKPAPAIPSIDSDHFEHVLAGEDDFSTQNGRSIDGKPMRFRIYTKPVMEDGKAVYIVQVAGPLGLLSVALNNLIFALFILIPITIVLAGIPGAILVRMTLKPVDRIADTLRRITAENLKLRIHIPDTRDEMKHLADVINQTIERLDRSFSLQQRFVQNIAHDLKAPMEILKTELETALEKGSSAEECKAVISNARGEIEEFAKMMESLLALTKFDADDMPLEITKVKLDSLAGEILNGMKILTSQKDIETSLICPHSITIDGDPNQLKRLIMNILDNAVKYTKRGGKISLAVWKAGGSAKIAVTDTGVGIPEDEKEYIFDRFYQAHKSRASKEGFGLGLSIAKTIAEAHKGTITVESEPGKGSTFLTILPLSYPV
jgi:signal transduction histidine kinase